MYKYISVFLILILGIFILSCGDDKDSIVNAVDTTAPAAISNLKVMGDVDSTCILAWTATGDDDSVGTAASYDLRYATDSTTLLLWADAMQFPVSFSPNQQGRLELMEVDGLNPDSQYYFALKVSDESDNMSEISNIASEGPPDRPTVTITSPQQYSSIGDYVIITADATDNVGVAYVKFFIGSHELGIDATPPYTTTLVFGDYYDHGEEISIFAQAFDTDLNISGSNVIYCIIDTTLFTPDVSIITTPTATDSSVHLTWNSNQEPDFYRYVILYDTLDFSGTHAAAFSKVISTAIDTSTSVTGLLDSVEYYFQVMTEDNSHHTSYGNVETATTKNAAPESPHLSVLYRTDDEISIIWSMATEHDFLEYNIYRSLDETVTTDDILVATTSDLSTVSCIDSSIEIGTTYYYSVFVSDIYGLSSQSNILEVDESASGDFALEYNGSSDYCIVPHYSSLNVTTTFTIEAWVYPYSNKDFARIVDKTESSCCLQYSLLLDNGSIGTDIGRQMSSTYSRDKSNKSVPINEWHHVAMTYNAGTVTYYYDGAPVDTNSVSITYLSPFATDLNFGRRLMYNEFYFHGLIDEIRIWNIARSAADIASTYNTSVSGASTGLIGYWNFDEGMGQIAHAIVGNNCQLGSTSGEDANDPTWVVSLAPLLK